MRRIARIDNVEALEEEMRYAGLTRRILDWRVHTLILH
jgi:hypothetical protein